MMKNNVSEMEREVSGSGVVQLWQVLALFDTITITITNHHHGLTACSHQDKILPWWEYVNHMHLHYLHEAPINLHSNCFKLLGEGFCSPGKSLPCCWVSVEPEVIGGDFLGDDGDHDDDMVEL